MHSNAQALILRMRRPTAKSRIARPVAVVTARSRNMKMPYRLSHRPRPNPIHIRLPRAVVQIAAASHSRSDLIPVAVVDIIQKHIGDGVGAAPGEGERGHIGGGAGDGDVIVGVGGAQLDGLAEPRSQRLQV